VPGAHVLEQYPGRQALVNGQDEPASESAASNGGISYQVAEGPRIELGAAQRVAVEIEDRRRAGERQRQQPVVLIGKRARQGRKSAASKGCLASAITCQRGTPVLGYEVVGQRLMDLHDVRRAAVRFTASARAKVTSSEPL